MRRMSCEKSFLPAALCAALAMSLFVPSVSAVTPATWELQSEADFSEGEFDATAVTSLGEVRLARQLELLLGSEQAPAVVSAVIRGGEELYATDGTEAKVYRVVDGKAELLAELPGAMAACMIWRDGELLVGTGGEDAGVYRVSTAGAVKPLWKAEGVTYVWAVQPASNGGLYAATGPEGKVFAIDADGNGKAIYEAGKLAKNILCLAVAADGTLYAGTDEQGLVVRIDVAKGSSRVILDAAESEISALVPDVAGGVFAATADAAKASPDGATRPASTTPGKAVQAQPAESPDMPDEGEPAPAPEPEDEDADEHVNPGGAAVTPSADPTAGPMNLEELSPEPRAAGQATSAPTSAPAGQVAAVTDEAAEEMAVEEEDLEPVAEEDEPDDEGDDQATAQVARARAMAARRAAAAGGKGGPGNAVYYIRPDGLVETRFRRPVTILAMVMYDGRLLLGTGNGGAIYSMSTDGDEVAQLADTEAKQITALSPLPDGRVLLATANGGSVGMLADSLAAKGTYTSSALDAEQMARWGTLRVRAAVPTGAAVTVATRSGNVEDAEEGGWSDWSAAVAVDGFTPITSPAARFLQYRVELTAVDGQTPVVRDVRVVYQVGNLPPAVASVEVNPSDKGAARNITTGGPQAFRHVQIKAADPNEDKLIYEIDFRQTGTETWVRAAEDLDQPKWVWDTRTVPDGAYELRVRASDKPSNPPATAMSAARISNILVVDNTPPVVSELAVMDKPSDGGLIVSGRVVDAGSRIVEIAYSVDSQEEWMVVEPTDGMCDSGREAFSFPLDDLKPGAHRIAIKATDLLGNTAYASIAATAAK